LHGLDEPRRSMHSLLVAGWYCWGRKWQAAPIAQYVTGAQERASPISDGTQPLLHLELVKKNRYVILRTESNKLLVTALSLTKPWL
jgi:hypothetical protein